MISVIYDTVGNNITMSKIIHGDDEMDISMTKDNIFHTKSSDFLSKIFPDVNKINTHDLLNIRKKAKIYTKNIENSTSTPSKNNTSFSRKNREKTNDNMLNRDLFNIRNKAKIYPENIENNTSTQSKNNNMIPLMNIYPQQRDTIGPFNNDLRRTANKNKEFSRKNRGKTNDDIIKIEDIHPQQRDTIGPFNNELRRTDNKNINRDTTRTKNKNNDDVLHLKDIHPQKSDNIGTFNNDSRLTLPPPPYEHITVKKNNHDTIPLPTPPPIRHRHPKIVDENGNSIAYIENIYNAKTLPLLQESVKTAYQITSKLHGDVPIKRRKEIYTALQFKLQEFGIPPDEVYGRFKPK